jgi:dihydrofolate reductase
MRTVTYGAATSLDSFIARADHRVDWLHWSADVAAITNAMWPGFDTIVMGRKTYEIAVAAGMSSYPNMKNYVFSRTLATDSASEVEIVPDDAAVFVERLKQQAGKGICLIGGGELANSLFAADLIDEVGLNIHPIILGDGIPMFHELQREIRLKLTESRVLDGGCVLVNYRVMRDH